MKAKRATRRRSLIRRDPAGRVALAVGDYLKGKGWDVIMTTGASVERDPLSFLEKNALKRLEHRFIVGFIGHPPAELKKEPA